jgi:hypothetical protein
MEKQDWLAGRKSSLPLQHAVHSVRLRTLYLQLAAVVATHSQLLPSNLPFFSKGYLHNVLLEFLHHEETGFWLKKLYTTL